MRFSNDGGNDIKRQKRETNDRNTQRSGSKGRRSMCEFSIGLSLLSWVADDPLLGNNGQTPLFKHFVYRSLTHTLC